LKRKVDLTQPLAEITFRCGPCSHTFRAAPALVSDDPGQAHHPFAYLGDCPKCGQHAPQQQQERALLKAWANATGPVTPEGKAATAKNLEGHPTPEEALRTRFNAMKHGLSARTAQYFPAKPDGYAFCASCKVDRDWCARQPACETQTKLFMLHHAAFEQRDPTRLNDVHADFQAAIFALMNQMVITIIGDGVTTRSPKYTTGEDGETILVEYLDEQGNKHYIYELNAHPLFKPLGEFLSRNNLSLGDLGMTTKVIEDHQDELGRLQSDREDRELIGDFMRQTRESQEALHGMMARALEKRGRDPVLIEHQRDE